MKYPILLLKPKREKSVQLRHPWVFSGAFSASPLTIEEGQIVEILGVVSMFGFMNRWNDSMATPLEEEPVEVGEKHLAKRGWNVGKHKG